MANQIILAPQKFDFAELVAQFPARKIKKKIFFQSELRSLANGDAAFGVIAYPAWKEKNSWEIGNKISGVDFGINDVQPFTPPLAFANNELLFAVPVGKKQKKKGKPKKDSPEARKARLVRWVRKISKNKELMAKSSFLFHAGISQNPHLEYNVTLDMNGNSLSLYTNPSPPAKPEA